MDDKYNFSRCAFGYVKCIDNSIKTINQSLFSLQELMELAKKNMPISDYNILSDSIKYSIYSDENNIKECIEDILKKIDQEDMLFK